MRRIHPAGLYEAIVEPQAGGESQGKLFNPESSNLDPRNYMIRVTNLAGETTTMHDPYAFEPMLTEYDLHLLSEGTHWKSYHKLGAHPRTVAGVEGVNFAVWAQTPRVWRSSATSIAGRQEARVRKHSQRHLGIVCPWVDGRRCTSLRQTRGRHIVEKCDPYGFAAEIPPRTANKVVDISLRMARPALDHQPCGPQLTRSDFDLRNTPRQLAARPA
jgi:1,4-alpha-glucan branching enzyme